MQRKTTQQSAGFPLRSLYRGLAQDAAVQHGASPAQQKPGEIKLSLKLNVKMPC